VTEDGFTAIAAACDRLLRASDVTLERVAIPWLHLLGEHPNNLRAYEHLLADPNAPSQWRAALTDRWRVARTLARSVRAVRSADPVAAARGSTVDLPARIDLLVVSHLVRAAHLADPNDFYFGPLQGMLAEQGISSLLLLRNHLGGSDAPLFRAARRGGTAARLLLPRTLGLREETRLLRRARREAHALKGAQALAKDPVEAGVAREAARRAVTEGTAANLRLHEQVQALCRRFRPRAILVTYEGHAWERCVWHAARAVDRTTCCIGYQHTVLWRLSHAVRRSLGPGGSGWDPDVVLTVGDVTRESLARGARLGSVRLATYGTHRRAPVVPSRSNDDRLRCLVIPEGIEGECLVLFDFVIASAPGMADLRFVLRTHPVMPFAWLARRHRHLRTLPPNVELSEADRIEDDFARCRYALYRGTSASVYAVLAGVKPYYVARPEELPFDPLHALGSWRETVTSPADFAAAVAADRARPTSARAMEYETARALCEGYSVPLRPQVLMDVLSARPAS